MASATRGVEDAIENWWHMEQLAEGLREEIATANLQIDRWERDYISLERRLNIQPYVQLGTGISFTVGGTFIGLGIAGMTMDNSINDFIGSKSFTTGCVIVGVTTLVYVCGRYVFKWW